MNLELEQVHPKECARIPTDDGTFQLYLYESGFLLWSWAMSKAGKMSSCASIRSVSPVTCLARKDAIAAINCMPPWQKLRKPEEASSSICARKAAASV